MANDPQQKGTLIRGADGSLYYIPDQQLQAFKLPDDKTAQARSQLDAQGIKAAGGSLPAISGAGLVTKANPDDTFFAVNMSTVQSITGKK